MQTLKEIRHMLSSERLKPNRKLGQNFLVDGNIMRKMLCLSNLSEAEALLEVGAGTGSLTEELLASGAHCVAVELDRGLFELLQRRLANEENLKLLHGDILIDKHTIWPEALSYLPERASLVSNLPYSIATPLVAQCLVDSWHAEVGRDTKRQAFDSLTFTVQKEVADRFCASPGSKAYGPVSILVSLLGRTTRGSVVPATAFWPRPKIASSVIRIDFDSAAAASICDVEALSRLMSAAFGHRRKQIGHLTHTGIGSTDGKSIAAALCKAGINPKLRPEQISPEGFGTLAHALSQP